MCTCVMFEGAESWIGIRRNQTFEEIGFFAEKGQSWKNMMEEIRDVVYISIGFDGDDSLWRCHLKPFLF